MGRLWARQLPFDLTFQCHPPVPFVPWAFRLPPGPRLCFHTYRPWEFIQQKVSKESGSKETCLILVLHKTLSASDPTFFLHRAESAFGTQGMAWCAINLSAKVLPEIIWNNS